jgi:hypothetical protein
MVMAEPTAHASPGKSGIQHLPTGVISYSQEGSASQTAGLRGAEKGVGPSFFTGPARRNRSPRLELPREGVCGEGAGWVREAERDSSPLASG